MLSRSLLTCVLLLASRAGAEIQDTLAYTYYDAVPKPGQSLSSSLTSASPIKEDGTVYHGHTKWNVAWTFRWDERDDGTCKISKATLRVTGTITMPRLIGGDAEQKRVFEQYAAALKQHELGHYQVARDAAAIIDRELLALPAMKDCARLERAANEGAHETLERQRAKERQYDVSTDHGKTQGAWLEK